MMLYECIFCFLFVLQLQVLQNKVECSHAFGPLDNMFSSLDSEVKSQYGTTFKPHHFEIDRAEFPDTRPQHYKHKKSKKTKKKPHKHEAKAKRKSEKKKYAKRFVKVRDDSLSKSRETAKGKPVDIIVHIKMND